jgi:uncharacterized protein YecE (DUF72 family)
MPVLVGTSGWQYRDWRGAFYPADVPQRLWLEHYGERFATVENNNAFYRLPDRATFEAWRDRTPADFVMAVKASRYLTHIRRLRDPAEPVARLLAAAAGLGTKLGPVLLQLPPTLTADPQRLEECLRAFAGPVDVAAGSPRAGPERHHVHGPPHEARPHEARRIRVAVEPRHTSWWTDDIRELLARHDAALAWTDRLGRPLTPLWRTAGWGYLRFHEGAASPWPRYGEQALRSWARRIADTWPEESDIYVYFNNDPGGAAVADAAFFAAIARQAGREVTRTVS